MEEKNQIIYRENVKCRYRARKLCAELSILILKKCECKIFHPLGNKYNPLVESPLGIKAQAFVELSKNTSPFGRFPMPNNNFSYNLKKKMEKS